MRTRVISAGIILLSFFIGIVSYSYLPDMMPMHWNAQGEIDGYMGKLWGLFMLPIISLGLFALFLVIPKLDPRRSNLESFKEYYQGIILMIVGFLFYIYILTILAAIGYKFNMVQAMSLSFAVLFYYMGIVLKKTKSNFFVGIRTPWTLSDEKVWEKTHDLGGKLFKVSGIIAFFGVLFKEVAIFLMIIPTIVASIFIYIYSYLEYAKIHKGK
ncbi:MAG: hypothetical protein APG08_01231 [Candidatus Methanofastidiosum methylothiophilum]|jgi:uncharacterized membrane protein|uniref:DUF1648 domain-containing protein n=1 Tax=Candidatus Methanofastidiosum methylothiophilum TaxID=1705564 RepID=A0A150JFP9_9EURY|nr:MAG: hypothetical protein AN188_01178 [Candidatus Methanofastidiosum methylthiophilus]MBP6933007.1 SdpI family protein [Methanofastidiosum sp.]OQC51713.1 MAG: hypothetical protein BWX56_00807 [Euryarchaeota archaeon ADurb.Bin023]KYC56040.1 MAG: hypothetical protein APG08_01231 [Candidatus Methanofastidiosum methylthiophilus]KYC56926.1 MAG: hypothetical protein APG09_01253 [Candidatus Methanofastidiosum methylthiophilus]